MKVKIKIDGGYMPEYATSMSAGADIRASQDITIMPGERALVHTGLFVEIPEGYELQIRPRSGLALKYGITVLNSPGTIDADYRNEVGVILANFGHEPFCVKKGDRIAQMVLCPVTRAEFETAEMLSKTERSGGFGSTGI